MGNKLQARVQKLSKGMNLTTFNPEVCISYATGCRMDFDDQGCGPGMFEAAYVIKFLFDNDVPCYSGLQVLKTMLLMTD